MFVYCTTRSISISTRSTSTSTIFTRIRSPIFKVVPVWLLLASSLLSAMVYDSSNRSNGTSPSQRSEEHTSELQSRGHLVCRLLLEKKKTKTDKNQNNKNNMSQP